MNAIIE
jgi:hypothetical protein